MKPFTLEELYGVGRSEYCKLTGISEDALISHLEAEVKMLSLSYEEVSVLYRESCLISPQLRYFEKLLQEISKIIDSKKAKILRIQRGD